MLRIQSPGEDIPLPFVHAVNFLRQPVQLVKGVRIGETGAFEVFDEAGDAAVHPNDLDFSGIAAGRVQHGKHLAHLARGSGKPERDALIVVPAGQFYCDHVSPPICGPCSIRSAGIFRAMISFISGFVPR